MPSVTEATNSHLSLRYEDIVRDFKNSETQYIRHLNMILKVGVDQILCYSSEVYVILDQKPVYAMPSHHFWQHFLSGPFTPKVLALFGNVL